MEIFRATNATLLSDIRDLGCMYHKDDGACPVWPASAYHVVDGDVWCQPGLDAHLRAMALGHVNP